MPKMEVSEAQKMGYKTPEIRMQLSPGRVTLLTQLKFFFIEQVM